MGTDRIRDLLGIELPIIQWLEARGVDAIVAQGLEAGGHRGTFLSEDTRTQIGTLALLPQIVKAVVRRTCCVRKRRPVQSTAQR